MRTHVLAPLVLATLAATGCSTFVPGTAPPSDAAAELPDGCDGLPDGFLPYLDGAIPEPVRPCVTNVDGVLTPGTFPDPTCDDSTGQCASSVACPIVAPACGSPETCLPLTMYPGPPQTLRIRDLHVVAPPPLAGAAIAQQLFESNIELNATQCDERGNGTFNWLLSVDTATGTLTTGVAPVTSDPFGVGYCFYQQPTVDGFTLAPVAAVITLSGTTFTSGVIPSLNLPIFGGTAGTPAYLFPLRDVVFRDVTLSAGGNCIGSFNPEALDATCSDDPSTCSKWHTGGVVGGFIKLSDADESVVEPLNESLCVYLTGSSPTSTGQCEPAALMSGDYCSTTQSAGGCQDSLWFAATFAASAVKVDASGTNASCAQ